MTVTNSEKIRETRREGVTIPDYQGTLAMYLSQLGGRQLIAHQLESYNQLLTTRFQEIVQQENPVMVRIPGIQIGQRKRNPAAPGGVTVEVRVEFGAVTVRPPQTLESNMIESAMTPNDARLRNMSYMARLAVDANVTATCTDEATGEIIDKATATYRENSIGTIPAMVGSVICRTRQTPEVAPNEMGECVSDMGGYFILQGGERVILSQERMAENMALVFHNTKPSGRDILQCEVRCVGGISAGTTKVNHVSLVSGAATALDHLRVKIPHVKPSAPLWTVFRALGVTNDREIVSYIYPDTEEIPPIVEQIIIGSLVDAANFTTGEAAAAGIPTMAAAIGGGGEERQARVLEARGAPEAVQAAAIADLCVVATTTWTGKQTPAAFITSMFDHDLLTHIGEGMVPPLQPATMAALKARYLGFMTRRLLDVYTGAAPEDNRDAYYNKRVDTTGVLLLKLFRHIFHGKVIKEMQSAIAREITSGAWHVTHSVANIVNNSNIQKIIHATPVDIGIRNAVATGNFGAGKLGSNAVGVSQVLNRLNNLAAVSHLRRVSAPTEKTGKLVPPRRLHATQWGYMCTNETPEGPSVGIVKNLAATATITCGSSPAPVYEYLAASGVVMEFAGGGGGAGHGVAGHWHNKRLTTHELFCAGTLIFVNGTWMGMVGHDDTAPLVDMLHTLKLRGALHPHTAIVWTRRTRTLSICTEGGRIIRPLFTAPAIREYAVSPEWRRMVARAQTWSELMHLRSPEGHTLVEFMDSAESNGALVAMYPQLALGPEYTHSEIHPSVILGTLASTIPFPECNQSPRNSYQSAMGKQAVGVYSTVLQERMDTIGYSMLYPTAPIADTFMGRNFHNREMMFGRMSMVALATYSGYNQEDSVILNRDAANFGFGRFVLTRCYKDEAKKNQASNEEERFCRPDPEHTIHLKYADYSHLGADGLPALNSYIPADGVLIGKTAPISGKRRGGGGDDGGRRSQHSRDGAGEMERDISRMLRNGETGFVDKIIRANNGDGNPMVKIRMRSVRDATIGDKFASRESQKGSCGLILPACDMPRTRDGVTPDLIMNPHGIPSRMTIAHLLEMLGSKAGALLGMFIDATPFEHISVDDLARMLLLHGGYEPMGNEYLYSGITGEQQTVSTFIAPIFYQKLRHLAADKMHARATGSVVSLTRQPGEGRARDGGLRFGEMERDCMLAHGCTEFTKERLLECSDNFEIHVCRGCGNIAVSNPAVRLFWCRVCDSRSGFATVRLPWAAKLVIQELQAMNIAVRLTTEQRLAGLSITLGKLKNIARARVRAARREITILGDIAEEGDEASDASGADDEAEAELDFDDDVGAGEADDDVGDGGDD